MELTNNEKKDIREITGDLDCTDDFYKRKRAFTS